MERDERESMLLVADADSCQLQEVLKESQCYQLVVVELRRLCNPDDVSLRSVLPPQNLCV